MRLIADDKIPFLRGVPESLGFETVYLPGKDISAGDVREADALMVRTRTRCDEALLHGSKVRLVVTATIGYDHIDTQYLAHAGIKWTNCPGCNATSVITALLPLAKAGLIEEARVECRVGSSEAGANADEGSAHAMRSRAMRVVSPFVHRHMAEVVQELSLPMSAFTMGVTTAEMVRGIQCLAHVTLNRQVREAEIWKLYRAAWNGEPFVSFTPAKPAHFRIPDPRFVLGSNRVLTGFMLAEDGRRMIAASAIDNLMKGAAGSAVQCANLMFGLDETEGLDMMPVYPA